MTVEISKHLCEAVGCGKVATWTLTWGAAPDENVRVCTHHVGLAMDPGVVYTATAIPAEGS